MNLTKKFLPLLLLAMTLSTSLPEARADLTAQQRWEQLPEAKKEEIRDNYRKFQALPESEKSALKKNYERFQALDPETRARVIQNYQKFKQLPPDKQKEISENFQKFQSLSDAEKAQRMAQLKQAQAQKSTRIPKKRRAH